MPLAIRLPYHTTPSSGEPRAELAEREAAQA